MRNRVNRFCRSGLSVGYGLTRVGGRCPVPEVCESTFAIARHSKLEDYWTPKHFIIGQGL
jgi:hypothetical protein